MASPPFNIAETIPGDSDFASQFPNAERVYRDVVESWLLVNHNTLGQHAKVEVANQGDDTLTAPTGVAVVWNNGGILKMRVASGPVASFDTFPVGTKLLFPQAAPPTGWALDNTQNDRVIRVNSAVGAGIGGSWTISGVSVDNHTLTTLEMPTHHHSGGATFPSVSTSGAPVIPSPGGSYGSPVDTGDTGGNQPHTHTMTIDGTWRMAYLDVVVGIKT